MTRTKAPRTLHYQAVAASLEAQNHAALNLIQVVRTAIKLDGEKMSPVIRSELQEMSDALSVAMWPRED